LATGYDVIGTVGNLADGRVELVVEGEAAELEAFRLAIRESELRGHIRNEQVFKSEASGEFRGFQIIA